MMNRRQAPATSTWPGNPADDAQPARRSVAGHVFLSYRSDDAEFALLLAAAMRRAGVRLWMDRLSILPGEDWRVALQGALHSAVATIPVLTRGYVESRYCQRELSRADRIGCPIIPVLLERIDERQWPMEVERAQFLDFSDWRSPNRFRSNAEKLVAVLQAHYGERVRFEPDATECALTDLAVDLYTRRGMQEYLEQASAVDRVFSQDTVRPEPPGIRAWMEQARFVVIDHTPSLGEIAPLAGRRSEARPLGRIRERHPRCILVGEAGSGKTSALHKLALNDIHHWQLLRTGPLPLLISLADWEDQMSLPELIRAHWKLPGDPLRMLARGQITLYLDGLNEIGGHRHHKAGLLRKWLASASGPQQVLITCRAQDYRFDLSLGLPLVQMDRLSAENIRFLVQSWLGPRAAPRLLARIFAGEDPQALRGVAGNLFLLGALCLLHKSRPGDAADENRGTLLRRVTAEMWLRQQDDGAFSDTGLETLEAALGALARAMIAEERGVHVSLEYALGQIGRRELLEAALRANFLQRRGGWLRFTWHAQMEYFAAATAQGRHACLRMTRAPVTGEGGARQPDSREMMIITAACLAQNPEEVLLGINRVNPFLALRCIANGIDVPGRTVEPIIGNLIRVAHSAQHDARVATACALAEIDLALALPVLLTAMREGAPAVRRAAVMALWQLDVPLLGSLQESLAQQQGQGLSDATRVAIRNLRDNGLPTLLMTLMHEDARLRRGACQALGWLQDRAGAPGLIQLLHDSDEQARIEAVGALGSLKDSMAAPALCANLRHRDGRMRQAAALALGKIGAPALEVLLPQLESDAAEVRRLVIVAMARIDAPQVDKALRRMRRDVDAEVRSAAVNALSGRRDVQSGAAETPRAHTEVVEFAQAQDVLESLLTWLRNSAWGEREEAARALNAWAQHYHGKPNDQLVARLCRVLREPDWMLRWAAVEALAALGNPAATDSLATLLQDANQPLRIAAIRAMHECGDARAARHLCPLARDPDNLVREAVAEALGQLAHPGSIAALGQLSADREPLVRLAAVVALGQAGRQEGEPHAIAALRDSDAMVRWYAVAALEQIGTQRCVPALRALTGEAAHPHWEPKETGELARQVLRKLGGTAAAQPEALRG